jgi:hypothetical protein
MKKTHTKEKLCKRMAYLEFVEDQLSAEIAYVDQLLKSVGFPYGLASVKEVAKDILQERSQE